MVIVSLGDIAINENYLVLYVKRVDMNIYGTLKGFFRHFSGKRLIFSRPNTRHE